MSKYAIMVLVFISPCLGGATPPLPQESPSGRPPRSYNFQYKAGEHPEHADRFHQETRDGSGRVQGSYSYVDPRHRMHSPEYKANENGFLASLIHFEDADGRPYDSESGRLARNRHLRLYNRYGNTNGYGQYGYEEEVPSWIRARDDHLRLYNQIAQQHLAIGAQRAGLS